MAPLNFLDILDFQYCLANYQLFIVHAGVAQDLTMN